MKPLMTKFMRFIVCFFAGVITLAVMAKNVAAQESLRDPTRPPATFSSANQDASAASAGPILQSVLISPGRKIAIISGETVKVSDKLGDARVMKISEGEVVLMRGGQPQTLKLFPGIEKRRTKSGVSVRDAGRRH